MSPVRPTDFTPVALGFLSTVYNAARRMTRNEHDAEDLTQDTYDAAFRQAAQLRDLAHCKAWLFSILRRRWISGERKHRARPDLVVLDGGIEAAEALASQGDLPALERVMIARMARPAITEALERLPEELRTALVLCDIEGFTYEEIATIMACPLGTVRSRIARARERLARQLAPQAAALGIGKEPAR